MTSTPVRRVAKYLASEGYEVLKQPVDVSGIPFTFSGILVGATSLDLVVLVDSLEDEEEAVVRRQILGLAQALDVIHSRRTLTVVFVGLPPQPKLARDIARVGRILSVGVSDEDARMRDALAVLLPLRLSQAGAEVSDWSSVRKELSSHEHADLLLKAAHKGSEAVEKTVGSLLASPFVAAVQSGKDA